MAFNGGKSASIGTKQLARRSELTLVALPSSSPAYTLPFPLKLDAWLTLRRFIGDNAEG